MARGRSDYILGRPPRRESEVKGMSALGTRSSFILVIPLCYNSTDFDESVIQSRYYFGSWVGRERSVSAPPLPPYILRREMLPCHLR